MKALFWFALSGTLVTWVLLQEQRVAMDCMDSGHVWRPGEWYELVGRCLPGKPRRILLPPLQVNPPTIDDETFPSPSPVPAL